MGLPSSSNSASGPSVYNGEKNSQHGLSVSLVALLLHTPLSMHDDTTTFPHPPAACPNAHTNTTTRRHHKNTLQTRAQHRFQVSHAASDGDLLTLVVRAQDLEELFIG
jgi:hypothetical protein